MNLGRKLKTLFFAICLFAVIFIVVQLLAPDKFVTNLFSRSGTLRVESAPTTNIFLDSKLIGRTPLQINLKEGVYTIKLVPEGASASLLSYTNKIKVQSNATTYVNREMAKSDLLSSGEILALEKSHSEMGQILVSTDPQGVFVSLDGEDRGVSPIFMDNVTEGEHELAVSGEGLIPRSIKVNILRSYKLLAEFKLKVDEDYQTKKQKQKEEEKKKKLKKPQVQIIDTPTGWLRVRFEPSIEASEAGKVNPGDLFAPLEEKEGWYLIEFAEGKTGWILSDYTKTLEEE